jgi:hypothetical protein
MQDDDKVRKVRDEDIAIAMLMMITNNIGQVSYLNATLHKCTKIFFVGTFLRLNSISCRRLAFAIDFWSKSSMEALFLEHEGYFGALGTFLRSSLGPEVDEILFPPKQPSPLDHAKDADSSNSNITEWLAATMKKLPSFQETFGGVPSDGSLVRKGGKRTATGTSNRPRTTSATTDDYRTSHHVFASKKDKVSVETQESMKVTDVDADDNVDAVVDDADKSENEESLKSAPPSPAPVLVADNPPYVLTRNRSVSDEL